MLPCGISVVYFKEGLNCKCYHPKHRDPVKIYGRKKINVSNYTSFSYRVWSEYYFWPAMKSIILSPH